MSLHDFIFSDRPQHRLSRHLLFWFCCWTYYMFAFYVPWTALPDWSTAHLPAAIKRNGSFYIWAQRRVINSLFTLAPFVLVSYATNYLLLPKYFFKNSSWKGIALLPLSLVLLFAAEVFCYYVMLVQLSRINPARFANTGDVAHSYMPALRVTLLMYPVIIGFALAIKMFKRSWLKQKETQQIESEKTKAELTLLKSQVHPHFLFNTLNNVYYFILSGSTHASVMIAKLSHMLRYIIRDCNQPYVLLESELRMIEDYVALEKVRYGNQLKMSLEINGDYKNKLIAPLLIIPIVENSFKHGASKMISDQWIRIEIKIKDKELTAVVVNSKPIQIKTAISNGQIGLKNVKKRLQLLYPANHELDIISKAESFTVIMKVKLQESESLITNEIKPLAAYAT